MSNTSNNHGTPEAGAAKKEILEPTTRMKRLIEASHEITVDKNVSISRYFNSGRELIKAAAALEDNGDIEKAFILYLRYTTLFLEKLVRHPEWLKADKNEKKLVREECNHVLDCADKLKKLIMEKYEAEYKAYMQSSESSVISESNIQRSNVKPQGSSRSEYDVDDIDKRFVFSHTVEDASENTFDPFNIEQLKQSFNSQD